MKPWKLIVASAAAAASLGIPQPAAAGGLVGNFFREIGNATGIREFNRFGNALDQGHRGLKQLLPLYGALEEGGSKLVHQLTSEFGVEVAGPMLAELIRQGIKDAEKGQMQPLPPNVKRAMARYYPKEILDSVRWRSGYGAASLQSLSLKLGGRAAITLDKIIVFEDGRDINKHWLVAHELAHVVQYNEWGITDFAKRYVRNYGGVEAAADRMADEWLAGKVLIAAPKPAGGGGGSSARSHRMYQLH